MQGPYQEIQAQGFSNQGLVFPGIARAPIKHRRGTTRACMEFPRAVWSIIKANKIRLKLLHTGYLADKNLQILCWKIVIQRTIVVVNF